MNELLGFFEDQGAINLRGPRIVILNPDARLAKRKKYTIRVEGAGDTDGLAVRDLASNELAQDYVKSFRTKDR